MSVPQESSGFRVFVKSVKATFTLPVSSVAIVLSISVGFAFSGFYFAKGCIYA